MPPQPDPTTNALLLLLRSRWSPTALESARRLTNSGRLDGPALLQRARGERLGPLLYGIVRDRQVLPPAVEAALRQDYLANAGRNMRLFHRVERLLRQLAAAGIPVLLLKGAALGPAVYGDEALRPLGDVDLLVRQEHVPAALRALTALDYRVIPPMALRSEVMLHQEQPLPVTLELHWNLLVPPFYQYILPRDWPWQGARPLQIGAAPALTLAPETQVIYLCAHLALHHHGQGMLWLHDIAESIQRYRDQIDWGRLLAQIQANALVLATQPILDRIARDWQAPIPADVQEQLRALRPSPAERQVHAATTAPNRSALRRFRDDLATLPGWPARLHFLWRNLFPPPAFVRHCYGVPPYALPLFYPLRWLRGLTRDRRSNASN